MGHTQSCSEPGIQETFGMLPVSSRNSGPSRRRGTASKSTSANPTDSGTMSSASASVPQLPTPSITCTSNGSGRVPIPGEASGSVSGDQAVDVKSPENESLVVGREEQGQHSDSYQGSMRWFTICFKGHAHA